MLVISNGRSRAASGAHLVGERIGRGGARAPEAFDLEGRGGHGTDLVLLSFLGEGREMWEDNLRKVIGNGYWLRTEIRIFCLPKGMDTNNVDVDVFEHVLCNCAPGFLNPSLLHDT